MAAIIARRYAQALVNILDEAEEFDRVEGDLRAMHRILSGLPSLGRILIHPGVPAERRKALLDHAMNSLDAHAAARGAVALLAEQRRLSLLPEVLAAYRRLKDARLGVTSVEVVSATAIDSADRSAWESALARVTGTPVRVEFRTDGALVGGAVARIGSVLYDGSVSGALKRIRQSLLGE